MRRSLTLLQLNDLHGYIEPHPEMVRTAGEWSFKQLGGLARIASLFDKVRQETGGATQISAMVPRPAPASASIATNCFLFAYSSTREKPRCKQRGNFA